MNKIFALLFLFVFTLIVSTTLTGRFFRVDKVPNGEVFSCNTCHTNGGGTPRNPFGLEVQSRVSVGGQESFWGPEIAALDSDGDGFTNGQELQDPEGSWAEGTADPGNASLVTAPGDSNSHPNPTSVTDVFGNPASYVLDNNYPNPFNPETNIRFTLPQPAEVSINVYNVAGELVNTLANSAYNSGTHTVRWNGTNNSGSNVSSGIYLYRMTANDFAETKRMILLK